MEWKERIMRYKHALESDESFEQLDLHQLKRMIGKLENMPMTLHLLIETGIGKTINSRLRKHEDLAERVKCLVAKWKELAKKAAAEEESEESEVEVKKRHKESDTKKNSVTNNVSKRKVSETELNSTAADENGSRKKLNGIKIDVPTRKKAAKKPEEDSSVGKRVNAIGFTAENGLSFDDILSMGNTAKRDKQRKKEKKPENPPSPTPDSKPTSLDWSKVLPRIVPDYTPLPPPPSESKHGKRDGTEIDPELFTSKKSRTKVFAGASHSGYTTVPSLYDLAMRVISDNVDAIEDTGGIPFDILRPAFARASPAQLRYIEDRNPYLIEDSDVLWEAFCKKDFRSSNPEPGESWREMHQRKMEEREEKLRNLSATIAAKKKGTSVAVTKQMFEAKAPREVKRRQMKHGVPTSRAHVTLASAQEIAAAKRQLDTVSSSDQVKFVKETPLFRPATSLSSSSSSSTMGQRKKPGKAPMMMKALKQLGKKRR